jgi:tetratricopeptide (TPR) repeat protein
MTGKRSQQEQSGGAAQGDTLRRRLNVSEAEFRRMGSIGAMYYEQGVLDKAQTIFEGLIELDPESVDAHSALGALYTRLQRDDEALVHLNRALALDDEQIAAHVNRAEVYLRRQEIKLAMADLERAMKLDPEEKDPGANRARAMVIGIHEAMEASEVM